MIPVKIQCGCGQKYSFDVEPVEHAMPWPVQCPVCGADGTAAANLVISHTLGPAMPPDLRLRNAEARTPRFPTTIPPTTSSSAWPQARRAPAPQSKSKGLLFAICGSAVLLLAVAAAAYAQRARHADTTASSHDTTGDFPRTLTEINAWYLEPTGAQNAATIYLQAFASLQPANGPRLPLLGGGKLPPPEASFPAAEKAAAIACLHANSEALRLLAQGTKYEECRYPIDLTRGYETVLSHLPPLRRSALMLELSAVMHAQAHQGKGAADDVLAALALGRSLEEEPVLSSQSVRTAVLSMAVSAWEQTLNRTEVSRESLVELMTAFKKLEAQEACGQSFERGLIAERVNWMALLDAPPKLIQALSLPGVNIAPEERDDLFARVKSGARLKSDQAKLDLIFAEFMNARRSSLPDRLKADDFIQHQIAEAASLRLVLMRTLLPAFAGHSAREANSLARLRLGLASVALEQFHSAHSVYPTELSELIPEYLSGPILNPFDGTPVRYQKDDTRFILRCIRPALSPVDSKPQDGDIVFSVRYKRPT